VTDGLTSDTALLGGEIEGNVVGVADAGKWGCSCVEGGVAKREDDEAQTEGAVGQGGWMETARAGRTVSRVVRRELTKCAFPSTRSRVTQVSSLWVAEERAASCLHSAKQDSSRPSSAAQAQSKCQAATGSLYRRSKSGAKQPGSTAARAT
jgi:hypothetical protein